MVPRGTPLPTRHVRSPLTTAQRAPCQKRGFGAARYQVARKRGSARQLSSFYPLKQGSVFDFLMRILGARKLSLQITAAAIGLQSPPFSVLLFLCALATIALSALNLFSSVCFFCFCLRYCIFGDIARVFEQNVALRNNFFYTAIRDSKLFSSYSIHNTFVWCF